MSEELDWISIRFALSQQEQARRTLDRRTDAGEWLSDLVQGFRNVGHPDDLAAARAVLSLPSWKSEKNSSLREWLERMEAFGRENLAKLEKVGWTYRRTGIGEGSLEPIGGHPAHGGGRGRRPNYITGIVWQICYQKELAARAALGEPDPAWARYRVRNTAAFRKGIAMRMRDLLRTEFLSDDAIGSAVNSWLKRRGEPPPWLPPAK